MVNAKYFITAESGFGALAGFFNTTKFKYIVCATEKTKRLFYGGYN
jgi:hypothetical protein